jgi:hypothetical protein
LNGAAADLARECERYERAIARAGGIDVQSLTGANANEVIISTELKDEKALEQTRNTMVSTLDAAFGQPQSGKVDFNNATQGSLSVRLREPLQGAGVALSEPQIQQLIKDILAFRNSPPQSGLITSFDQLSTVPGVNANIINILKQESYLAPFTVRQVEVVGPKVATDLWKQAIQATLFQRFASIQEGLVIVVMPPPVRGIGTSGGFRMMVEDRANAGPQALQGAVYAMMGRAAQRPGLAQVFSLFEASTPQLYLDIDRTKVQLLGVNMADVFSALQTYLGSTYVNDLQHPHPGRLHRADRSGGEERDPDRRVCQAAGGPGPRPLGRGRGGTPEVAADPDDVARLHLRRRAAGMGDGRWR